MPITKIKVGNLDIDNAIPLVAQVLNMDDYDNKVKSLAKTIHKKTDGNPFYVIMFLRSLYDEKLLQYNVGTMKWTWDDEAVNSKIVTENVASVLVNKMSRLEEETQRMLMVASCLGATFRLSAVLQAMKNISWAEFKCSSSKISVSDTASKAGNSSTSIVSSDLNYLGTDRRGSDCSYASSIGELEEEGLCEVDNEECHFVHDQIQSAAFKLICPDQRDSFRGRIGSILLQSLSPEELDASLFEVVGLLNDASSTVSDKECDDDELARMNLRAGIKALENAAFNAATIYFNAGREALGSRGWEGDHRTMLDLCSHGANACFLAGDFDTMNLLIDEVLSKDIDTKEKFRVSDIKIKSLHSSGNFDECIDVALDFRRQLGLPTLQRKPVSKFKIIWEYYQVRRLLKNKTAADIASLPALNDERYEMGQRMNENLISAVRQIEPTMFPLIMFQGITNSLEYGLDSTSSTVFAVLSMLLCGSFGKPHEGLEMSKAAELILEKPGMRKSAVFTIFLTHGLCYHWASPLQNTIAPLLKGYKLGLESGDTEKACWCLRIRSYHLYFIGRPLDSIQKELQVTVSVLEQIRADDTRMKINIILATVKKLRGIDVVAADNILDSTLASATSTGNVTLSAHLNLVKLEVFVIFQKWRNAIDLVRKAGNVRLFISSTFASVRYTFLEALTYLKAAQSASGWKWEMRQMKKCAHKTIQLIRGWAKKGNVNVVHYLYILEAELAVLNGKEKKANEKFKAAIAASSRNGFLQDRALAHELTSAYLKAQGDQYWCNYHNNCSRACYQEWGCTEKVEQLRTM